MFLLARQLFFDVTWNMPSYWSYLDAPMNLNFLKIYSMDEVKILNKGDKFAHTSVGSLCSFEGKQFVKDITGSTSCEISFGTLSNGAAVPFFHSHKENEENYIVLSGSGKFQVNDEIFDIAEGSVIRVSTNCDRNLKCTSETPMCYICIQAKEVSLNGYTMTDAEITERKNLL